MGAYSYGERCYMELATYQALRSSVAPCKLLSFLIHLHYIVLGVGLRMRCELELQIGS